MKRENITYYRTYSYGGIDGRTIEKRAYETIELAKEAAMQDTWNYDYALYKVEIIFDGLATEKETRLGAIPCGRDEQMIFFNKAVIKNAKKAIEEHKANKRIKEATREKRIAKELRRIENAERDIKLIENRC